MKLSPGSRAVYPPLDVPKPVAPDLWIVDSGPLSVYGLPLPVRMTVVRLSAGELWLHSPTRFTPDLHRTLDALGRVGHLVAPNIAHWSFLEEWQRACPNAVTWAAPGLAQRSKVKRSGAQINRDLAASLPAEWGGDFDQVTVPGAGGFAEIGFLHKPSRTAVLTDLIVNLEAEKLPLLVRPFARLLGVVAPNGKAPIYLRAIVAVKRAEAVHAASQMVRWAPERVIFSHGQWIEQRGEDELRRRLSWLLGRCPAAAASSLSVGR
jgi:hypothetical protein